MTELQIHEEVGVLENSIFLPVYMLYFVHMYAYAQNDQLTNKSLLH